MTKAWFVLFPRVLHTIWRDCNILQPEFVSVVDRRRAAKCQKQHRRGPGTEGTDTGGDTLLIMIAEYPVGRAVFRQRRFVFLHNPSDLGSIPLGKDELKVEWQVSAFHLVSIIRNQVLEWQVDLADQHTAGKC